MSKNNRANRKIETVDEKARLMSYASLTMNIGLIAFVAPLLLESTEEQAVNKTQIINIEKTLKEFGDEQKEVKKEVKEIRKSQGNIEGQLKTLISMANVPDQKLIESEIEQAQGRKRKIKKKKELNTKGEEKIAIEIDDVE